MTRRTWPCWVQRLLSLRSIPDAQTNTANITTALSPTARFEERWFTLGMASKGKLLAVSHTYAATGPASARVRIISAREATRNERRQYEDEPR